MIRINGTNEWQLTADDDFAFEPLFSADGESVIFSTLNGLVSLPIDGSASQKPISGQPGAVLLLVASTEESEAYREE